MADTSDVPRHERRDWRAALRWFGAEFLVVVTGVLVALVLNAWWGDRQSVARERAYLREIHRDLELTDSSLARAVTGLQRTRHATASLLRASYSPSGVPRDSLVSWLFAAEYVSLPTYSTGAAEALLQAGDLSLVRDDSARLSVFRMVEQLRDARSRETLVLGMTTPILQRERERTATTNLYADVARLGAGTESLTAYARELAASTPSGVAPPFATRYESLIRREDAFRDWRVVSDHLIVLQTTYERALRVVRRTREHVQAAQRELGG
jgi:hypothetical protein